MGFHPSPRIGAHAKGPGSRSAQVNLTDVIGSAHFGSPDLRLMPSSLGSAVAQIPVRVWLLSFLWRRPCVKTCSIALNISTTLMCASVRANSSAVTCCHPSIMRPVVHEVDAGALAAGHVPDRWRPLVQAIVIGAVHRLSQSRPSDQPFLRWSIPFHRIST